MSAVLSQSPAHTWFMQNLPEIKSRSRACLARMPRRYREDALAEVMAYVFKTSVSAEQRGVLAKITPYHCVVYAIKQYKSGRRLAGFTTTDVMSEATQAKGRCKVVSLSSPALRTPTDRQCLPLSETLADRRQDSSPYDETRRNLDYPAILRREHISQKARRVFNHLTRDRTEGCGLRIAHELKVSPGRVTQLKDELAEALGKHEYSAV